MAKFNLFNEDSWQSAALAPVTDPETIINNKAVGTIGQMISELRTLKAELDMERTKNFSQAYRIATDLRDNNRKAFVAMQVEISFSDDDVSNLHADIDQVLVAWKGKTVAEHALIWRSLLPALDRLRPYLNHGTSPHLSYPGSDGRTQVRVLKDKVTIRGNAAWDVYLASQLQLTAMRDRMLTIDEEDDPDSSPDSY